MFSLYASCCLLCILLTPKGKKLTCFSSNLSKVFPGSKRKSSDCRLKKQEIFPGQNWCMNILSTRSRLKSTAIDYGRNINRQEKTTHHSPWRAACTRRMLSGAYPEKTYEISLGLLNQCWTESETWHGTFDACEVLRGKGNLSGNWREQTPFHFISYSSTH